MKLRVCFLAIFALFCAGLYSLAAAAWTDMSTSMIASLGGQCGGSSWEKGCAGIGVNRLTGDVYLHIEGKGIYKSTNQGSSWTRIDNNMIDNSCGGRCETGWAFQVNQDNPVQMACFTLDGDAGYTADGTVWKKFAGMGRNWDFGSVDWGSTDKKVIIAAQHESGGKVFKSTDGGSTWSIQLPITVSGSVGAVCMIGIINTSTFIYSNGNGIQRSTDCGSSWSQVSTVNPASHVPVMFKGKAYLCTSTGLLVSSDNGATWQKQGAAANLLWGPLFGADENNMVVAGAAGLYRTTNGGTNWANVSALPTTTSFYAYNSTWYGGFTWDPINNILYAAAMSNPAVKNQLASGTTRLISMTSTSHIAGFSIRGRRIQSDYPFTGYEVWSLSGTLLYRWHGMETRFAAMPDLTGIAPAASVIRLSTGQALLNRN
jgi:hypothetical protein